MCGIIGWLRPCGASSPEELRRAADMIAHRGPDDQGFYEVPHSGLALAHNRLSIIDLSPAGRQPMFNEDGSIALIFNGEIYNFQELRRELESAGHEFKSRTDSEVLIHGYEQWGEGLLDRLCGMFAFAIWDSFRQSLFLARDPMGIKPLYFWWSKSGGFHFASEIKAFLALNDFRPNMNRRMVRQFLELNFICDLHHTSLEGVYKLPAGHSLNIRAADVAERIRPEARSFFSPPHVEPCVGLSDDADDRADRLYEVLDEVVRQHMIADVPAGVLLSGGLDSSIVAALASRHTKVRTISMAFSDSEIDERPYARLVADHIGSDHEEVVIHSQEVADDLEQSVWFVDDLFGDWGVISTRLLYKKCRDVGVKVVLVGEGSDELFGGYSNFVSCGGPASDSLNAWRRSLRLYRWYSGRRWGDELWKMHLTIRGIAGETEGDQFAAVRLFECRHQLPHNYNMKVDKASMSASVEARVPFLDVRVAREGFRTPRELLLREGTNKWLLRRAAERKQLLPQQITRREKFGASMAASWMDDAPGFRDFARDVILDPGGITAEFGLRSAMRKYFDLGRKGFRFPRGISIFSIVAWRLLLLNLWARRYCPARTSQVPLSSRRPIPVLGRT